MAVAAFQPAFDGFLIMGLILERMAREKKRLSELAAGLPRYYNVKEKIHCPPSKVYSVLNEVKKLLAEKDVDTSDGLRVDEPGGFFHVRASATEPMIRVIAENVSMDIARARVEGLLKFISVLVK